MYLKRSFSLIPLVVKFGAILLKWEPEYYQMLYEQEYCLLGFLLLACYIVSRRWGMTLFCVMLCASQELIRNYAFGRQASSCLAVMGRVDVLLGINSRSDNSCWVRWTKFSSWFRNVTKSSNTSSLLQLWWRV